MNRLAIKIKEARVKSKMSEKDLAKACGQNINYILQIESGKKVINEKIAEDILKILGAQMDSFQDTAGYSNQDQTQPAIQAKAKTVKPQDKTPQEAITPNDSWAGALSGVIKKYSILDELTGKEVGVKELSILGKKIEGIHFEKVAFVKVIESELPKFRIFKGDVLTLHVISEIQNQGIYYFEFNGKKMIRQLAKTQNNIVTFSKGPNEPDTEINVKDLKLLGKVVKVEFSL